MSEPKVTKEIVGETLTTRQEQFCQLYATDSEFFGNGVQSYLEIYDIDQSKPNWYKTACSAASDLLSNPKVFNRINDLLSEGGLNDQNADKQLMFLINQQEDKSVKLGALREYNKLKARITEKIDVTTQGEKITNDSAIDALAEILTNQNVYKGADFGSDGTRSDTLDSKI